MREFSKKELDIVEKEYIEKARRQDAGIWRSYYFNFSQEAVKGEIDTMKIVDQIIADYYEYEEMIRTDLLTLTMKFGKDMANILVKTWDIVWEEARR